MYDIENPPRCVYEPIPRREISPFAVSSEEMGKDKKGERSGFLNRLHTERSMPVRGDEKPIVPPGRGVRRQLRMGFLGILAIAGILLLIWAFDLLTR